MFTINDYVFEKIIGKGSFGKVYKVHKKSNKYIYAIKVLNLPLTAQIDKHMIINEIRFLASHNSINIIEYSTVFIKNNSIYIVMEYAKNGDLSELINKNKISNIYFTELVILNYFIQIAQAIQYLHKHNIIHRDIKTANIFIDNKNKLKLGDFGIIKILSNNYAQTTTLIGTPIYMPPELYRKQRYNTKFDIWSLGCVLYEIMTHNPPFSAKTLVDLKYKIFAGKYNTSQLKLYSSELRNIVSSTINTNPPTRPTIDQLLNLPFIHIKITETNNNNIKPLFFESYNIPRKPSDWNAIIKKYAQPLLIKQPTAKPLVAKSPVIKRFSTISKNPTYNIPYPPQKPKPISSRPHIKTYLSISPNTVIKSPQIPLNPIKKPIHLPYLRLSDYDNKEIIQLNLSINKLHKNIEELYEQLNIKTYKINYLKQKQQNIIENNKNIENNNSYMYPTLIPIQPFKKIDQEVYTSTNQLSIPKNYAHYKQPTCPNSKLIIKIGSKHDSNYFLNQAV
jgi:serine/threonine protein kinase